MEEAQGTEECMAVNISVDQGWRAGDSWDTNGKQVGKVE